MKELQYFTSFSIAPGLTQIEDLCGTKMYLVEGKERAALLDCGAGLGNIGAYAKTLTDKPLLVILTHGHVDHAMGSGTFDAGTPIYMNPDDIGIYNQHSKLSERQAYFNAMKLIYHGPKGLFMKAEKMDWVTPADPEDLLTAKPGDVFDLGGETLELCPGAGHTPGCLTVLLQKSRILLLGDAINDGTYLFDDYSLPVSELKKTLIELQDSTNLLYDRTLFCHGRPGKPGFGDPNMVRGGLWLCDAILEGRDMRIKTKRMGKDCFMAKRFMQKKDIGDQSNCNIVYSKQTLN